MQFAFLLLSTGYWQYEGWWALCWQATIDINMESFIGQDELVKAITLCHLFLSQEGFIKTLGIKMSKVQQKNSEKSPKKI